MESKPSLVLAIATLLMLCGCSSYEVTSSSDPVPLPDTNSPSLNVEVFYSPDNPEPEFTIGFSIPIACLVRFEVLNATGHRVKLLVDDYLPADAYKFTLDWKNDDGEDIMSGIYIYSLHAGDEFWENSFLYCRTMEDCEELRDED